jgi:hypothetical protein
MVDPNNPDFDFEGFSKYVINASELSNKDLNALLYSQPSKLPDTIIQ